MKINFFIMALMLGAACQLTIGLGQAQDIENFAPVVIKTVPEAGSKDVPPGEFEVRITFSKEMAAWQDSDPEGDFDHLFKKWSWASAWQNSGPQALGKPHYEADCRTCVLKVKLEPGKTYGWWINSPKFHGFQDTRNHPAVPYLLIFKTGKN
jgi:hypothetical protein